MHAFSRGLFSKLLLFLVICVGASAAQSVSGSGAVRGRILDPTGAVIPNATVEIANRVSGYKRTTTSDASGNFAFLNLPRNTYHLAATAPGFSTGQTDVEVNSSVTVQTDVSLAISGTSTTLDVTGDAADLIETTSVPHTDIDRGLFNRLPLQSVSSALSSLVTLATPGAIADSNGMFHGIGDHAENSFSIDGQPITDQQSKVFSNQIPTDSIQSLEVISGAPPAEFGGKTSLVINATTRSGLGVKKPTGSITTSYGTFGTVTGGVNLALGTEKFGNFVSLSGLNTGRFLDPPEFQVIHSKGNQQNLFDRVDFQASNVDSIHINAGFTRSWFQTPNSFDAAALAQDQRAQIRTFNIAPSWTRVVGSNGLWNLGFFVRRDNFNYYPSSDPLADQPQTVSQNRKLLNAGIRADFSYVKGRHNLKLGALFQHTFLNEDFGLGFTDPTLNDPCIDINGDPSGDTTLNDPSQCAGAGFQPNVAANPIASAPFIPLLGCLDLTRGTPSPNDGCATTQSALFRFHGHADIKEIALYIQDTIKAGDWTFNLGLRGDIYRGLSRDAQLEPRLGVAYNIKATNTVLRASYARILESPFNENLVLASNTSDPVLLALFGGLGAEPIRAGQRNEFHAGFQQAFGKYLVVDGDYLWKYTHNAYDFSVLLNTPIFFPIAQHNSKIDGFNIRASLPEFHGLTAFVTIGHVDARFFAPQVGGLESDPTAPITPFRIDHDQKFQQTTHIQYQPKKTWPWFAFNWRYDSGIVAGEVPVATDTTTPVDLTELSADQQLQAGLFCGSVRPTLAAPLTTCAPSDYGSTRIKLPAPGTADDDRNPPRVAPRHLFDASIGHDNLFGGDRHKVSLRLTAVNLTNRVALYNFLSTFSGTHFVTPRTLTAEVGFHF